MTALPTNVRVEPWEDHEWVVRFTLDGREFGVVLPLEGRTIVPVEATKGMLSVNPDQNLDTFLNYMDGPAKQRLWTAMLNAAPREFPNG